MRPRRAAAITACSLEWTPSCRAISAGELRPDIDPGRLVDVLLGTVSMPLLFCRDLPAVDQAESIVDQVLLGFATPAGGTRVS
jgi:hypothetical protein